ncbi:Isotrichodermin C-15 hydroxylase [Cytospora mali]|uniref:Isotrichodermin C-15 hydroxylase n=1 Tax=Cytospora mali TaxID=578113 RepID=A0A194V8A7_CYTMA|nr:Isotrichodermin C-15 hydroxylase [Valsa mali var. pyri (nom. inval.)]
MSFLDTLDFEMTAAYAGGLLITTVLLVLSYSLLLHPLRGIPDPFLSKLTVLNSGYATVQKRFHLAVFDAHERYGPVNDQVIKAYTYTNGKVLNALTVRDRDVHRAKRKMVGQAVNDRAMRAFEPTMAEQVRIFLVQILRSARASEMVNVTDRARYLGLDIVGRLSFGYDLHPQTRADDRFVVEALYHSIYRMNIFHALPMLGRSKRFGRLLDALFFGAHEKQAYFRLVETMIKECLAQDIHARADFFSFAAEAMNMDAESVRKSKLWSEALLFIIAGGDTVATGISAVFWYVARNRDCYAKVAAEVRAAFSSGADIKGGPALAGCTYLRACIDESLRLAPPSGTVHWREQDAADVRPLVIDGTVVPRGTLVGVCLYSLHRNPAYFDDPHAFLPERWLVPEKGDAEEQRQARKRMQAAFAPFSAGARACPGKAMAYLEMGLTVAKTLWYFDFEPAPGALGAVGGGTPGDGHGRNRVDEFQLEDIFVSNHEGPYLAFRPRGTLCEELELLN